MLKLTPEKMNTFFKMIVGQNTDSYSNLIEKYFDLKYRIENIDEQNWYLRKGLKSNIERLNSLKDNYLYMMRSVNNNSLSQLQQNYQKSKQKLENLKSSDTSKGLHYHLALNPFRSKVRYCKILLNLKIKYETLPSLEELTSKYKKWANSNDNSEEQNV